MHIIMQVHFAIMFLILADFCMQLLLAVCCFLQNCFPPLDLLHYQGQDGKGWDRIGLFIVSVGLALRVLRDRSTKEF